MSTLNTAPHGVLSDANDYAPLPTPIRLPFVEGDYAECRSSSRLPLIAKQPDGEASPTSGASDDTGAWHHEENPQANSRRACATETGVAPRDASAAVVPRASPTRVQECSGSGDSWEPVANPISDAAMSAAERKFEAIAGQLPLEQVTAKDAKEFVDGLRREGVSEFTVLRYLGATNAVTKRLGSFEHPGAASMNPFCEAAKSIRRLAPPVGTVPPFPLDSLQKLLSSPGYLAMKYAAEPCGAARFWVPLLCLFACARPHDIIGLQVSDLERHRDAWVLRLSSTMSVDPRTSAPSVHSVPLHEELVHCGFVSHVAQRKLDGHVDIFGPGQETAKLSANARRVSRWFSGLGRTLGIGQGCSLFDLRRAFIEACHRSGVADDGIRLLAGWTVKSWSTLRARPSRLSHDDALGQEIASVRRLRFDGLELSHLYVDDPLSRSDEAFRARQP